MPVLHGVEGPGEGVDPRLVAERGLAGALVQPGGELGLDGGVGAEADVVAALLGLDVLLVALLLLAEALALLPAHRRHELL